MSFVRHSSAAAFAVAALILSGCGGSGEGKTTGAVPLPVQSGASAKTARLSLNATGTPQSLPSIGGISSSILLPANNAASNATLAITLSTSAPPVRNGIPAKSAQGLLYFTMQPSGNTTFDGAPKIAMTMPSAPQSQGAFYAWIYNVSTRTWTDFGSMTVSGTQVTFGGATQKLTLDANAQYVVVPFTAAPFASCPTPGPTPTPTPTPVPVAGNFYLATNTFDNLGNYLSASVLGYDEATGQQKSALNLGYGAGTIPFSTTLSSNAALLYVTAATSSTVTNSFTSSIPIPGLTIINTATNTIAHQTTIAGNVFGGTLSADQTRFYGVGYDSASGKFVVFVFDASTGNEQQTIPLPSSAQVPRWIVVNNAATTAYVTDVNSHDVYTVDLTAGTASLLYAETQQNDLPLSNIALDPTESKLYLGEFARVLVLNPVTGAVLKSITPPGGANFYSMTQSDDRKTILTTDALNQSPFNGSSVISTASDAITTSFTFSQTLDDAVLNANGSLALLWQLSFNAFPISSYAIPSGTLFYTVTTPSNVIVESAAAQ
ncbi:MAG TPA: hypothetical protein VJP85_14260 [Candidatus Baltobacteraceae bacterium]|nr:hypothetical protein [Candidatus Baltobacteraceae bacterium]